MRCQVRCGTGPLTPSNVPPSIRPPPLKTLPRSRNDRRLAEKSPFRPHTALMVLFLSSSFVLPRCSRTVRSADKGNRRASGRCAPRSAGGEKWRESEAAVADDTRLLPPRAVSAAHAAIRLHGNRNTRRDPAYNCFAEFCADRIEERGKWRVLQHSF